MQLYNLDLFDYQAECQYDENQRITKKILHNTDERLIADYIYNSSGECREIKIYDNNETILLYSIEWNETYSIEKEFGCIEDKKENLYLSIYKTFYNDKKQITKVESTTDGFKFTDKQEYFVENNKVSHSIKFKYIRNTNKLKEKTEDFYYKTGIIKQTILTKYNKEGIPEFEEITHYTDNGIFDKTEKTLDKRPLLIKHLGLIITAIIILLVIHHFVH